MNAENLFDGVGMVIDDHVYDSQENGDRIVKLVAYLENEREIPLVKYKSLPNFSDMNVLSSIKFLLLDWNLAGVIDDSGFGVGYTGQMNNNTIKESLQFLHKVIDSVVIPIFIFSNNEVEEIQRELRDNNCSNSNIFIKSKSELFDANGRCTMFDVINDWLQTMPSIYVVQKWSDIYARAMNSMAQDMMKTSAYWPNILWKCYTEDGINPSDEIASVISQNVLSRIQPVEFDEQILGQEQVCTHDVLKNVLSKHCFIKNDNLGKSTSVGDVFKKSGKFYLNIRPACDCVGRNDNKVEIYLLRGDKINDGKIKDKYSDKYGKFSEQSNTSIVGPIDDSFIEFKFKDLQIVNYDDWEDKRIGRVIPPYMTYIAQKYGLYIHRQGLPRIPKEIIGGKQENVGKINNGQQQIESLRQQLAESNKRNKELAEKIEKLKIIQNVKSQPVYRLYNCKVNIVPNFKKRRLKK